MKQFLTYLLEQDLNDLKDQIIQNIKSTTNPKILRKINKFFELDEKGYKKADEFIIDYLMNRCGYNKKITTNIKIQIKHCGAFGLCKKLFEPIVNNDSKDFNFLTSDKLIHGNDLFKLIKDYARSVLKGDSQYDEIDDEFDELIKLIADFDIGGKVATGKMEFLTSMFLKDLNIKNQAGQDKVVCDINSKQYGFEYKISGGRITGNKEESKPLSSKVITDKFREIIEKELRNNKETDSEKNKNQSSSTIRSNNNEENYDVDLEEKITSYINLIQKQDNLFRNGEENKGGIKLEKVLDPLFEFGLTEKRINEIVLDCLISQLPNLKINNDEYTYLLDKYPIAIDKCISNTGTNNFKQIFLILHLCNYWQAEKWDYLLLFEKPDKKDLTGKYHVINAPSENNLIKSMDQNIDGKAFSSAFPAYGSGTNSQNQAPMIKYKK